MIPAGVRRLKELSREDLAAFVTENASVLTEEEALAILENAQVTPQILGRIAQVPRVTGSRVLYLDGVPVEVFLYDPHPRVFAALLVNQRLREDDLLALIASRRATPDQLRMIAEDIRWSYRYGVRKALVLNPDTPRAAAASQLKFLSRRDLRMIHANPQTSVYVRRCIERLQPRLFSAAPEVIDYNGGPDA